ncbi:MAG: hypothetical protein J5545_04350 [Bacteroidaceae bacterium]|nr:hypothetical protein [Bacteroidaceae bacterium]
MKTIAFTVLTIAALAVGQTVRADQTWTITNTANQIGNNKYAYFTVTRTETDAAETVKYRTVSLTALAGRHYEEQTGELTFKKGEESIKITINELELGSEGALYRYCTPDVSNRHYRFELLDVDNITVLASSDRDLYHNTQYDVYPTTIFKNVLMPFFTDPVKVDDASSGFGQGDQTILLDDFFSQTAPKGYLTKIGTKLAMTFGFQAKEKSDGYQYIQVLVDEGTNYDSGNKDGDVGDINYAHLLAGFGHDPGKKNTSYANYTFPVPGTDEEVIPFGTYDGKWNEYGNTVGRLYSQKIKPGCLHAESGRLLVNSDLYRLFVRFDASGKHDDTWYVKNFKALIQVIDEQNPTVITGDVRLSPGPYTEGSTFYVSVPFSEIVVVPTNANPTISTNWGDLKYHMGSGTNVLVFKGTIGSGLDPTAQLTITGLSGGPVRDLWGNPFTGQDNAINVTFPAQTTPPNWTGTGTKADPYLISDNTALDMLYQCVNVMGTEFGHDGTHPDGYFFKLSKDIKYQLSSSNTPNYNAIGTQDHPFRGHFDGNGMTVEDISIYSSYSYQGLFGYVVGGTLENIILKHPRIVQNQNSSNNSDYAAGIVGCCVGGTIRNCLVYQATVKSSGSHCGAIVGNDDAFQEHNYYRNCYVGGETMTNVFSIKVGEGVLVSGPIMTYTGIGYYRSETLVQLTAPVGKGFDVITVTKDADSSDVTASVLNEDGTSIIMPDYDITVSATYTDLWDVAAGNDGSEDRPYIISNKEGWDALAYAVNRGEDFYQKYFKLSPDFDNSATPVTLMVGNADHAFKGTIEGNGRTVTVNLEDETEDDGCAPIFRTERATIKNLRMAGTIATSGKFAAGFVSHMRRSTLEGCASSVTIISSVQGDGTHGGLVGILDALGYESKLTGCVFDGVICCTAADLTNSCGGLVGWNDGHLGYTTEATIHDCLYAPAAIPDGKYALDATECSTIIRGIPDYPYCVIDITNSYFTEPLGKEQEARKAYPLDTRPANVYEDVVGDYGFTKSYKYHCIEYGGKFYSMPSYSALKEDGKGSIFLNSGDFVTIKLESRALWRDGDWNTLCLPFALSAEQMDATLPDADIRTLSSASFENGTLTLNFTAKGAITSIDAGVPYIIRWDKPDPYIRYYANNDNNNASTTSDIAEPTFTAVILDFTSHDVTCDLGDGKSIAFTGTRSATTFTEDDKTKLFVGAENKLYYPLADAVINAQRGYFQLEGLEVGTANGIKGFNLNLGDDSPTLVSLPSGREAAGAWFTLDGRRLDSKPTRAGVYINKGIKVVVK